MIRTDRGGFGTDAADAGADDSVSALTTNAATAPTLNLANLVLHTTDYPHAPKLRKTPA